MVSRPPARYHPSTSYASQNDSMDVLDEKANGGPSMPAMEINEVVSVRDRAFPVVHAQTCVSDLLPDGRGSLCGQTSP